MILPNLIHERCGSCFELVSKVRGFATIPAQKERIRCPKCATTIDLYIWCPSINGRRNCAILIDVGVSA